MGAHNPARLCDLGVFVEEAAEAVASADPHVWARAWVGKWPQRCGLAEGTVRAMFVEVPFVLGQYRGGVPLVDDEDPVQQFARRLPTNRSVIAFARGARTGVVTICTPAAANTVSKTRLNLRRGP